MARIPACGLGGLAKFARLGPHPPRAGPRLPPFPNFVPSGPSLPSSRFFGPVLDLNPAFYPNGSHFKHAGAGSDGTTTILGKSASRLRGFPRHGRQPLVPRSVNRLGPYCNLFPIYFSWFGGTCLMRCSRKFASLCLAL